MRRSDNVPFNVRYIKITLNNVISNNKKIVLASIAVIVAAGLLVLNPSILGTAEAQMYADMYGYGNSYKNHYPDPKSSHVEIQKISCLNDNTNINSIDITEISQNDPEAAVKEVGAQGANTQNGGGLADRINFDRNLVNICVNVYVNDQIKVSSPEEERRCGDCFIGLTETQINSILQQFEVTSITGLFERLAHTPNSPDERTNVVDALEGAGLLEEQRDAVLECLGSTGVITPSGGGDVPKS